MLITCCACRSARFTAKTDTPETKHAVLQKGCQVPTGWPGSFKGHWLHETLEHAKLGHTTSKLMVEMKLPVV